jgi:hypothetical protein
MKLPISKSDIVTPYNISAEESADLLVTANNKASFVRRGGYHYTMTMGLRPYNLLKESDNARFYSLATFLTSNPVFEVPLINMLESKPMLAADQASVETTTSAQVGDTKIVVGPGHTLRAGDFIRIGDKPKVYQVMMVDGQNGENIHVAHPIVARISAGTIVHFSEEIDGIRFCGVYGKFLNEDFGLANSRIEDGILGKLGPLKLKEKL